MNRGDGKMCCAGLGETDRQRSVSHDTHDGDDEDNGDGLDVALLQGTDQVIECQVGSIKTKRRLPTQTPYKPCQLPPQEDTEVDRGQGAED